MPRLLPRTAAFVTVAGLACAGAVTFAGPATAATTPDASALAGYLVGGLVDGNHYEPFGPGFTDVGLSADGAFALAATGADDASAQAIATYLDSQTGRDYAMFGGDPANFSGGAAAKLALLAEVTHRDPHDYAQLDLVQLLADTVCTAAQAVDDPADCAAAGNYFHATSVFSQALGVIAQQRVGTADPAAVDYLLSLQRPDGAFPSLIPNSGDADPDSTAIAIQALAVLPAATAFPPSDVATAITGAVDWLAGAQHANGSWGPSFNPDSVNSTGVALQAFQITRDVRDAHAGATAKGLAFLAGLQNAGGGLPVGDVDGQTGSDVRASTQALGGITGTPFGTLSVQTAVTRTATTVPAAVAAAAWLPTQLTTGDHYEGDGYVQVGTTADVALGLLASGGQDLTLGRTLSYLTLETTLRSYVSGSNFGDDADSAYVGATAKLATLLELAGQDPRDVGAAHRDLVATLLALQSADGRLHDRSSFGDYANVFGQSFAVLALTGAGEAAAADSARTALLAAQCDDGGFPTSFGGTCTSTPDATGIAVQALNAGPGTAVTAGTAGTAGVVGTARGAAAQDVATGLQDAVDWLTANQAADGSYAGAPAVTNSTGYAALGLLAVGQNATDPRAYLTASANDDGGLPATAPGASDTFATAQALPALAGLSFLQTTPTALVPVSTLAGDDPSGPPTTTAPPTSTPPTTTPPGTTAPAGSPTATRTSGQGGQGSGTPIGDGSLPDTGADIGTPLLLGVVALGLGAAVTAAGGRRRRAGAHAGRRH